MATGGLAGRTTIPKVARNDPAGCHDNPPPGGAAGNRDGQDISPPREGYLKSQLEILSEYIEQIMKEDAQKVLDDYREKIKTELHGILPDDKDVNDWMLHPEKELTLGFDTESAKSIKRAKFLRRDYNGLHDLSVLIMNAPINKRCPWIVYLARDETDDRCREFTDARDTDKVLLVAPDNKPNMPGGGDLFRTFAFKLSYERRNKIVKDLSRMMQRVEADEVWDLSILYGEETYDKERPNMSQEYFSARAQVDLFDTVCTEIETFHWAFDKDKYGRELEAKDYIVTVPAVQAADRERRVTIKSVTSSDEVTQVIADFMRDNGVKSKTALVVFNGHGYADGNLCLDEEPISQITLLKELHEHRNAASGVPHSIDVVWGSCYSYKGIPEQINKEFIQVIQRGILPERDPAFRHDELMRLERVTLADRPLRSFHLTCEEHKMTCSIIEFKDEASAEIKAKEHKDLHKLGEKQAACGYNTGEDRDVLFREPAADLAPELEDLVLDDNED